MNNPKFVDAAQNQAAAVFRARNELHDKLEDATQQISKMTEAINKANIAFDRLIAAWNKYDDDCKAADVSGKELWKHDGRWDK